MQRNYDRQRPLFSIRDWLYGAIALGMALVGILIVGQALQTRANIINDHNTALEAKAQTPQSDAGPAPWQ